MTDKIRAALETRLNALLPAISTAWENVEYKPLQNVPYQQVNMLYATPNNVTLGCERYYALGVLQIVVNYPLNSGSTAAEDRANLLVTHFKRGTVATHAGQSVMITNTPSKRILGSDGSFFKIAVSINYRAEVIG